MDAIRKRTLQNGETRYTLRVRIDGKRKELSAPTRKELLALHDDLKAQERRRRRGLAVDRGPITYDDLAARYLAQYPHSDSAKQTVTDRLKKSRAKFGDVLVRDLTADTVAVWNASLTKSGTEKPASATYRSHVLDAMRRVLAFGVTSGYLDANVAALVTKPKADTDPPRPFESWDEVEAVAAHLPARLRQLPPFVCATGLRPQEWIALPWSNIDVKKRELRVWRTVRSGKIAEGRAKTHGSLRVVRLTQRAIDALSQMPRPLAGGLLFTAAEGGPINLRNFGRREWTTALEKAGLDYRPPVHMRHTFATLHLADGVPVEWIAKQMGHADSTLVERRYGQWLPRGEERWLDHIDRLYAEGSGRKVDGNVEAQ